MKKFFFFAVAAFTAVTMNAQVLSFGDAVIAKANFPQDTIIACADNAEFALHIECDIDGGKVEIDANNANFGTPEDFVKYSYRLKTGGKYDTTVGKGKLNKMTLAIPEKGTLKICARTGSATTERAIVLAADGQEIFRQALLDEQATKLPDLDEDGVQKTNDKGELKWLVYFPVYSVNVEAGDYDLMYPDGAVNFYAFELVTEGGSVEPQPEGVEEVAGAVKAQKVVENGQLFIIKNGVRFNAVGAVVK